MRGRDMILNQKVQNRSLVDLIEEKLEQAIVSGEYEPGAKLSEQALADSLGVSRGPLREAICRLEGRKLVQRSPNRGVRITALSKSHLIDLLVIREALEGMACRLAAKKMSGEEIDDLENLLTEHRNQKDVKQGTGYAQPLFDYDFHVQIARGSRNERLISMICGDLYDLLRVYRFNSSTNIGRASAAIHEHEQVLEALKARDADRAEYKMREHVRKSRENLERMIED